jgi:2-haloacid dehalogenase
MPGGLDTNRRWKRYEAGDARSQGLTLLHQENLELVLAKFGISPAKTLRAELDELNLAWHRLDPVGFSRRLRGK